MKHMVYGKTGNSEAHDRHAKNFLSDSAMAGAGLFGLSKSLKLMRKKPLALRFRERQVNRQRAADGGRFFADDERQTLRNLRTYWIAE